MATAMKRLGVYLGFVDDDLDYEEYEEGAVEAPVRGRETHGAPAGRAGHEPGSVVTAVDARPQAAPVASTLAPTPDPSVVDPGQAPPDAYSIHTIHPRSYNEARRIGEEFRGGSPVIMNLTEMDDTDAKRIVDFAAGLVFAMRGSMERVTKKVFLLSPANVDVRDAPAVQRARDGFFNQS